MAPSPVTGAPDPSLPSTFLKRARRWRRLRARLRIWRRRMRSHPVLHLTWRTAVGLIGGLVLLAGLVMCVTPGPGLAGILLGLAILATEFAWARGLLRYARNRAHHAKDRLVQARRRRHDRTKRTLDPQSDPGSVHRKQPPTKKPDSR